MRKVIFLLPVIFIGFVSCKKDKDTKPECRIITSTDGSNTKNISYNAEDKVATVSFGVYVRTYQYTGNTVVMNESSSGSFSRKIIYTLNNDGLVANMKIEKNISGSIWENQQFDYSGTQLQKITTTTSANDPVKVETISWNNGNPVTIVSGNSATTLEYYTNKPSQDGDYLHWAQLGNYGVFYLKSKNLLKSINTGNSLLTMEYSYDADGKISSMAINSGSPQLTTISYQYQCN